MEGLVATAVKAVVAVVVVFVVVLVVHVAMCLAVVPPSVRVQWASWFKELPYFAELFGQYRFCLP